MIRQTLITGGGGGIGSACALRFAQLGDEVTLCDISEAALLATKANLERRDIHVNTIVCDFNQDTAVESLLNSWNICAPVAIVHTAGLSPSMADWRTIVNVNLVGTARLLDGLLPYLQAGSSCVCIASNAGYALPEIAAVAQLMQTPRDPQLLDKLAVLDEVDDWNSGLGYGTSKRAVRRLVAARVTAWAEKGARLNSLSPGITDTPMGKQEFDNQPFMADMIELTPLKRSAAPDEIASAALFLCSEDASFISGVDLLVDGGCMAAMGMMPK